MSVRRQTAQTHALYCIISAGSTADKPNCDRRHMRMRWQNKTRFSITKDQVDMMEWIFRNVRKIFDKRLISFVVCACPSAPPSAWNSTAPHWTVFDEIWYLGIFRKCSEKFSFHTRIAGTWHEDRYKFLTISRSVLLRMRNVSDKSCTENQNTHFVFSNVFSKMYRLWDNVEKYCRGGQATYDNMPHAHCMLDK